MLSRVIARVLGLLIRTRERSIVRSTATAGPVPPEPTTPTGNDFSAVTIPQFLRLSPVPQPSSRKKNPAQPTTQGRKSTGKKSRPALTETLQPEHGNSTLIPVLTPRHPLPARPHSLKKKKRAPRTTQVAGSTNKKQQLAPTETTPSEDGNCTPTPVRKTRRLVKP